MLHVDKGGGREHDRVVQQQTRLAIEAIGAVNDAEEIMDVHKRHVGVNVFEVGLHHSILQRRAGEAQGTLGPEVADILRTKLAGQRANKAGEVSIGVGLLERVEELRGAGVSQERGLIVGE